jgi:hypothetical protein
MQNSVAPAGGKGADMYALAQPRDARRVRCLHRASQSLQAAPGLRSGTTAAGIFKSIACLELVSEQVFCIRVPASAAPIVHAA